MSAGQTTQHPTVTHSIQKLENAKNRTEEIAIAKSKYHQKRKQDIELVDFQPLKGLNIYLKQPHAFAKDNSYTSPTPSTYLIKDRQTIPFIGQLLTFIL